ncbi:hypothetical protein [Vibrio algivorus]|uniref:Uncharacterized protein n=1 Tax=Vibrio algivorus TaxID=1667024 RepID=A0A557P369_9VIBR|nr:hypothetical protein [Vibrio algivorus]TVO35087.1 hypothetical protein FOF44_12350 [Vibrio algivorus]
MISEKAPPIFLFYLDEMLSSKDQEELYRINAMGNPTPDDLLDMSNIIAKSRDLSKGTPIPVPLVGDLIGMIPDGYKQSVVKSVDMVKGIPVLKGNVNSSTITLKSSSTDFVNAMMGVANYLFSQDDALPRVCFFSPELVVIGGVMLNMTKATKTDSTEQVISIELQRGDKQFFTRFHTLSKKAAEIWDITVNTIT